jgi:NADH-quinone oxidoreductase subunit L
MALSGIGYAVWRYRGIRADKAHAGVTGGVARLLENAYGIDALIDRTMVRPLDALARRVMTGMVDRGVDRMLTSGGTLLRSTAAFVGSRLQDGDVGKYAWLIAAGGIVVLAALTLH